MLTNDVVCSELEKLQKKNDQMDKEYQLMRNSDTQMRENMTARGARRKKLRENHRAEEKKVGVERLHLGLLLQI